MAVTDYSHRFTSITDNSVTLVQTRADCPVKPSGSRSRLKEKISWDKQGSVFNIFTKNVFSDLGPKSLQGRATLLWNLLSQPQHNKCCKQLQIYKTMACSTNIFIGHGNCYLEISRHGKHKRSRVSCLYVREPLLALF